MMIGSQDTAAKSTPPTLQKCALRRESMQNITAKRYGSDQIKLCQTLQTCCRIAKFSCRF